MAGEWMLKDDWEEIDGLEAKVERLKQARDRTGRALVRSSAECDALRLDVERLTRERDDALVALGRQTYTAPYRELVAWNNGDGPDPRDKTDAEWIAIGRLRLHAAGLAAVPAGDPETLDRPGSGASEGDPHDP